MGKEATDSTPQYVLPADYLTEAADASKKCLLQSTAEQRDRLGELTQLDSDIACWVAELAERPEAPQLKYGHLQFGSSIYLAYAGMYAQAYASLRTFLELSFAAVHFSVNELDRRKWMSGRSDFSWSAALNRETGLLSKSFVQEFNPPAIADGAYFAGIACECYRECSEFIHGKHMKISNLPPRISHSTETLEAWTSTAKESALSTLFLLFIRYAPELISTTSGHQIDETLKSWFPDRKSVHNSLESFLGIADTEAIQ